MEYFLLTYVFLKVGLLGFGGGMAIISLIQGEVLSRGWLTQTEFVDIVAISQVTPGPVGMNCATYVGYAVGGLWGALVASVAIVVPSLVIMLTICYVYDVIRNRFQQNRTFQVTMRIIRILVVLLVAHAAYTLMTPASFIDWKSWVIFAVVFILMLLPLFKNAKRSTLNSTLSNPILLILLSGLAGWLLYRL
mgnify:FL=1